MYKSKKGFECSQKHILLLGISIVLFIVAQILMRVYNPYVSYPRPEAFVLFDEAYATDNPLMRFITVELYAMVEMLSATEGVMDSFPSGMRVFGAFTFFISVTLCQVWVIIEEYLFHDANTGGGFFANAAVEIAHYLMSIAVFYAITVASLNFPRLLFWFMKDGFSFMSVIGFLIYVVFLALCLPSVVGFILHWLGYCISLLIICKLLGLLVPIGLVRAATTPGAIAQTPIVLLVFAIMLVFDRVWVKYCKPLCYFLVLGVISD